MGRWTYYSPLVLGIALAALMYPSYRAFVPGWSLWAAVPLFVAACVFVGVQCQLVMIGAQGVFVQAWPVPGGRTIRGRGAVMGGACLLLGLAVEAAAGLLASEGLWAAATVLAGTSVASWTGVAIICAWCWPTAVCDFADES